MKKFLLVFSFLFSTIVSFAQISTVEKQLAMDLIKQNQIQLGLTDFDVENTVVSSTYLNNASGIRMVYLNQTFKSIPVFNKMQVLAFKNNELVSNTGNRVSNIEQIVNLKSGIPSISAANAVQSVINDLKLSTKSLIQSTVQANGKLNFGNLSISEVDIIAELVWLPITEKNVVLTW
jgi:Zn-dependent metalloprotease